MFLNLIRHKQVAEESKIHFSIFISSIKAAQNTLLTFLVAIQLIGKFIEDLFYIEAEGFKIRNKIFKEKIASSVHISRLC